MFWEVNSQVAGIAAGLTLAKISKAGSIQKTE
jgi:hypothetical protein